MRRLSFLKKIVLVLVLLGGRGYAMPKGSEELLCRRVHQAWLTQALQLTKNCVGFSAPVSARALAYLGIGMYEVQVERLPGYRSLSGQLQQYERSTWQEGQPLYWPHVVNTCLRQLTRFLYANRPPAEEASLQHTYQQLQRQYDQQLSKALLDASAAYGQRIATAISNWALTDGGHEGYNRNYPASYRPAACIGCWVPTVPGYLSALQPYWGNNRLLVATNGSSCTDVPFLPFATDSGSAFYQEAAALVQLYKQLPDSLVRIARYWDDAPGYSGTPAGHQFALAQQLAAQQQLPLAKMLQLYALLGIALNDAMIRCWQLKYQYNLIRPVTYIQRYIEPYFNTVIPSPPFPEFPSGHSFQSGAAAQVLQLFWGDGFAFTDSTQQYRSDINGSPRSFTSFEAMAKEISMSRFYGGIHFKHTLTVSLSCGQSTGRNTIQQLQFLK